MKIMVQRRVENGEDVQHLKDIEKIVHGVKETTIRDDEDLKTSSEHDSTATMETENSLISATIHNTRQLKFSDAAPEVIAYLPLPHELEPAQRDALWWSFSDYEVFAQTAKSISKEVRKHHTLTGGIDEAYRRAGVVSSELQDEDDVFEAMKRLSLDSGLAQWCTHGHSRRGLERSGSRLQSTLRGGDAKTMTQCIVELQKVRALAGTGSNIEELLRRESAGHTKTARLFARMMGQADAAAATRSHTLMRRWSDLGSTSTNSHQRQQQHRQQLQYQQHQSHASGLDLGDDRQNMRCQRTASLPQQRYSSLS